MDCGPTVRCVSVLRASQRLVAGNACSVRYPGRSASDHAAGSATWLHCHTGLSAAAAKSSLRSYGTEIGWGPRVFGFTQVRGVRPRFPDRPKYGQPSFHVTGDSAVNLPTELKSIIE